jgi:hypothetical protein
VVLRVVHTRLTFRRAFQYIDSAPGLRHAIVAVSNADIIVSTQAAASLTAVTDLTASGAEVTQTRATECIFGRPGVLRAGVNWNNTVLALLRSEEDYNGGWLPRTDSQDTWVFRAPLGLSSQQMKLVDFELGQPRCDNRLAQVLRGSGRHVLNPSLDAHLVHVQFSTIRHHTPADDIRGVGSFVPLALPLC